MFVNGYNLVAEWLNDVSQRCLQLNPGNLWIRYFTGLKGFCRWEYEGEVKDMEMGKVSWIIQVSPAYSRGFL